MYSLNSASPFATATNMPSKTLEDITPPTTSITPSRFDSKANYSAGISNEVVVGFQQETQIFVEGPTDVEMSERGIAI